MDSRSTGVHEELETLTGFYLRGEDSQNNQNVMKNVVENDRWKHVFRTRRSQREARASMVLGIHVSGNKEQTIFLTFVNGLQHSERQGLTGRFVLSDHDLRKVEREHEHARENCACNGNAWLKHRGWSRARGLLAGQFQQLINGERAPVKHEV